MRASARARARSTTGARAVPAGWVRGGPGRFTSSVVVVVVTRVSTVSMTWTSVRRARFRPVRRLHVCDATAPSLAQRFVPRAPWPRQQARVRAWSAVALGALDSVRVGDVDASGRLGRSATLRGPVLAGESTADAGCAGTRGGVLAIAAAGGWGGGWGGARDTKIWPTSGRSSSSSSTSSTTSPRTRGRASVLLARRAGRPVPGGGADSPIACDDADAADGDDDTGGSDCDMGSSDSACSAAWRTRATPLACTVLLLASAFHKSSNLGQR